MKKTRLDIQQDFLMTLLRPLVFIWMWFDAKRKVIRDPEFSFCRKEPYVLLANHTYMFDVVHVPLRIWKVPFIIASQTLFTKQPTKFLVSQVAHVISKSKGRSDTAAIMSIFSAVKRGYPILIFPEGDTTFYGETGYIEESTMKLIKKLKLDVITCNIRGGFLSRPRWGTGKRSRHYMELHYKKAISKEQLQDLTLDEINDIVKKELYQNAYEHQRIAMIPHKGKKLAEGIENAVYVCPHCQAINSIVSHENTFHCKECKKEGSIDKYGFIHDFVYDNLVDWNHYQRNFSDKLRNTTIESTGMLYFLNFDTLEQIEVGQIGLKYENGKFIFTGAHEKVLELSEVSNPTLTLRRDFGFVCEDQHYLVKLDSLGSAFLRVVQNKY
ncbi:MAG: 1-acyl-sn-glycerol-3-phosphate acyltransferase [Firmicutes bacterium]|nr:1-acyl-sn-glycerol-3-phosphate acyltransferase [Bacillota bacterium]